MCLFGGLLRVAPSDRNIIQTTCVILSFLVATFKNVKETGEINFNKRFDLTLDSKCYFHV